MHSQHRDRYHLRPLSDVYPGDRVSLDPDAMTALAAGTPDVVDWDQVDADARQVLDRHRTTPTHLWLDVRTPDGRAVIEGSTVAQLLVAKSPLQP